MAWTPRAVLETKLAGNTQLSRYPGGDVWTGPTRRICAVLWQAVARRVNAGRYRIHRMQGAMMGAGMCQWDAEGELR